MEKFLLLGGSGYIGSAFIAELERRGESFRNLSRRKVDYTRFSVLLDVLRTEKPTFLINCAGYTGKPNVDACEKAKADTLLGNVTLPQTIAQACEVAGVPWGHISSGCIYTGAKITIDDETHIARNLMDPDVQPLWRDHPERLSGFTEDDLPNFSFREPPCSFYSGSKALGEEILADAPDTYIWRLRIPFDHQDNPRNYLTKIQRYARVYDNLNSLSHRGDFVRACLDLLQLRAPFGTYNVTNPGWTTARDVVRLLQSTSGAGRNFEFFESDAAFYETAAIAPRSNAILDTSRVDETGVTLRSIDDALKDALNCWSGQVVVPAR